MHVPTQDLRAQLRGVEADVRAAIDRVLASGRFVLGPEVQAFEREAAAWSGALHAVGLSSGTDAILAGLMALGVGPGDVVVTTPFTFVASVTAIARLGARVAFVDIDPATFLLDSGKLEAAITPRTRAIMPVHLFGLMADMPRVHDIARAHDLAVLEDAAQAIGARLHDTPIGRGSKGATLSFFPTKNLGAMGDAGMLLTDDSEFAARVRLLRSQGQEPRYVCQAVGGNFRLDELQAAVLRAKLPRLEEWTDARRRVAGLYRSLVSARGIDPLRFQLAHEPASARHVYHQLVARTPSRDALCAHLAERSVETAIYYPVPLHLQPAFASWGYQPGDFPEAERAARETLALPIYPELADDAVAYVVDQIAAFFA